MNPARALHAWWKWLNTPNELRWGNNVHWHPQADKNTLNDALRRANRN